LNCSCLFCFHNLSSGTNGRREGWLRERLQSEPQSGEKSRGQQVNENKKENIQIINYTRVEKNMTEQV